MFSTATETIVNLTNERIRQFVVPLPHHLDNLADSIPSPDPVPLHHAPVTLPPIACDPSLPSPTTPIAYTDVYVDNFVGAAQRSDSLDLGLDNRRQVWRLIVHAMDDVFHLARQLTAQNGGSPYPLGRYTPEIAHGAP